MNRHQRGAALLIVLWACTLLAILIGDYAVVARIQGLQARNVVNQTQAHYAAEQAVMRAIFQLQQGSSLNPPLRTDGAIQVIPGRDGRVSVTVRDDSGKIDLNHAPPDLLRRWLQQLGAGNPAALADAIMAWRSPIVTQGQRQQINAAYQAAGLDYAPPGQPFANLEELAQVLGISPELAAAMQPDATLWSNAASPDLQSASAVVLAAAQQISPAAAAETYQQRMQQAVTPAAGDHRGAIESLSATATTRDGSVARLDATVRLDSPSPDRSYTVLRWQEGAAP